MIQVNKTCANCCAPLKKLSAGRWICPYCDTEFYDPDEEARERAAKAAVPKEPVKKQPLTSSFSSAPRKEPVYMPRLLDEVITHDFEGYQLPVPKKYDEYLTFLYGDYMEKAPLSTRLGCHEILLCDIGKYDNLNE